MPRSTESSLLPSFRSSLLTGLNRNQRRSLATIEDAAASIWKVPRHRYFTGHDNEHAQRIIKHLESLLAKTSLIPDERYVLLAACLLHDIGMQLETGNISEEKAREEHEKLAAQWIIDSVDESTPTKDIGVIRVFADAIARVVIGHRATNLGSPEFADDHLNVGAIRVSFLGALLQLADELDLEHNRVDEHRLEFQEASVESQSHWYRHLYVMRVEIDPVHHHITVHWKFRQEAAEALDSCRQLLAIPTQETLEAKLDNLRWFLVPHGVSFLLGPLDVQISTTPLQLPPPIRDYLAAKRRRDLIVAQSRLTQTRARDAALLDETIAADLDRAHMAADAGRLGEAATNFEEVGDALRKRNYQAQAAWRYEDGANLFEKASRALDASRCLLKAATAHLAGGQFVFAETDLMNASGILPADGDPGMRAELAALHGRTALYSADVATALHHLEEARRLVEKEVSNSNNDQLLVDICLDLARAHEWAQGWSNCLRELSTGLERAKGVHHRIRLLVRQWYVLRELGRTNEARAIAPRLNELLGHAETPALRALIHAVNAETLASDDTDGALLRYDSALSALIGQPEGPFASSLYLSKQRLVAQQMMRVGTARLDIDVVADQDKRLDLWFDGDHPLNRAFFMQQSGLANMAEGNPTEALQHYFLAIEQYEAYGAWPQISEVHRRIAQVLEQVGHQDRALVLYARLGRIEDVQRVATRIAAGPSAAERMPVLLDALRAFGLVEAVVGRTAALGALADVIPDQLVPDVVTDLLAALSGDDATSQSLSPRRQAAQAFAALAPRIPDRLAVEVVEALLDAMAKPSWWTTPVDTARTLGRVVAAHPALPVPLQRRTASRIVDLDRGTNPIVAQDVIGIAYTLVRGTKQAGVRTTIAAYLKQSGEPFVVAYRCALGLRVSRREANAAIELILAGINAKLDVEESRSTLHQGQYLPEPLAYFRDMMTKAQITHCVAALTQCVLYEHNSLSTRAAAITTLGDLADRLSDGEVAELCGLVVRITGGELPISEYAQRRDQGRSLRSILPSATVWLSARLVGRLDADHADERARLFDIVASHCDDAADDVRQASARAIGVLRHLLDRELAELELRLVGLLYDGSPRVSAQAVLSIVDLVGNNQPFPAQRLHQRVLALLNRTQDQIVHRAVAFALGHLTFEAPLTERAEDARSRMRSHPSFEVRQALIADRWRPGSND